MNPGEVVAIVFIAIVLYVMYEVYREQKEFENNLWGKPKGIIKKSLKRQDFKL